jgi:hypothetical protein
LRESGSHSLQRFLPTTEAASGRTGDRFSRTIIYCGTEAAGHDDHLNSLHGCMDGRDNILLIVADNRFESNFNAEFAKFVGKEERIGIGLSADE